MTRSAVPSSVRHPAEQPFLDAAAGKRQQRCLELVQSVEAVLRAYRDAPDMPLDLIDRCERALVQAHVHNLMRLPEFPDLSIEAER